MKTKLILNEGRLSQHEKATCFTRTIKWGEMQVVKKRARENETKSLSTKRKPILYQHNAKRFLKVEEGGDNMVH